MQDKCAIVRKMKNQTNKAQGTISISAKGTGYVAVGTDKNKGQDPEVDYKHLHTALHGDTVEILLHPKGPGRQTAEVTKIIERAKMRFSGVLEMKMEYISSNQMTQKCTPTF